jgi:SOS-response transcriptional repressor LexA
MAKLLDRTTPRPVWAAKIHELREHLGLNQTSFGHKLQSSAIAVCRWERGVQEPSSHSYIEIGNLAGDPGCWYFWERAGLRSEDVMKVMPAIERRLRRAHIHAFEIVAAASHGEKGDDVPFLHDAPTGSMIAAPREGCSDPSSTRCLTVHGDSMAPTICDGYIVAMDSSQTDRSKLDGKIVVAWKEHQGLFVSRFKRYDHTETLQS